jgi:hypothetical protein
MVTVRRVMAVLVATVCLQAGLAQADESPFGELLVPAGDFTGDGLPDVLGSTPVFDREAERWRKRVTARRGHDGQALWSVTVGERDDVWPAQVGQPAAPGVLVASHTFEKGGVLDPVGGQSAVLEDRGRLTVTALDARGAAVWERRVEGVHWLRSMSEGAVTAESRLPTRVLPLDALPGAATDLALVRQSGGSAIAPPFAFVDARLYDVAVVDGATGQITTQVPGVMAGPYSHERELVAVPDITGDGLKEVGLITRHLRIAEDRLTVYSPGSGPRWSSEVPVKGPTTLVGAGDTDGDGVPDVVLRSEARGGAHPARSHLLSGATGRPLMSIDTAALHPAGDIDGDGRTDLVIAEDVVRSGEGNPLRAVRSDGSELWRTSHPSSVEPGELVIGEVAAIGDVDGDSVADFHSVARVGAGTATRSAAAISGRSGRSIWSLDRGATYETAVGMRRDDVAAGLDLLGYVRHSETQPSGYTAVDGTSGKVLWTGKGPDREDISGTADLDGDGRHDVLLTRAGGHGRALSGRTGALLWP